MLMQEYDCSAGFNKKIRLIWPLLDFEEGFPGSVAPASLVAHRKVLFKVSDGTGYNDSLRNTCHETQQSSQYISLWHCKPYKTPIWVLESMLNAMRVCLLLLLPALTIAQPLTTPSTDTSASSHTQMAFWVFPACFSSILLGCAYSLWTILRSVRWPRLCWLLGAVTLVTSVAWTVVDRTAGPELESRYPLLSFWAMFAIAFVSESSVDVCGYALFKWTVLGFALILALASFTIGVTFSPSNIATWLVSHSTDAPVFFSLWSLVVSTLFHLPRGIIRWMSEEVEMDEISPAVNTGENVEGDDMTADFTRV